MPLLALLCLRLLHICYSLLLRISLRWKYLTWRPPQSLTATRQRLPNHLAIILATDSDLNLETTELALLESVERAIGWCHVVGIEKLTVYDSQGEQHRLCLAQHIHCQHICIYRHIFERFPKNSPVCYKLPWSTFRWIQRFRPRISSYAPVVWLFRVKTSFSRGLLG